jgi:hypothetical protein
VTFKSMEKYRPEWFSAPRDVLPDTTIVPGRLVISYRNPEGPPYLEDALPIPLSDQRVTEYKWSYEKEREQGGSVGLFASFLSGLAAGGNLSGNLTVKGDFKIEVENLKTSMFDPSNEYLKETLHLPRNIAFLTKEKKVTQSLYIITGVKTAYGATVTRSRTRKWGAEGDVSVSPNVPGLEVGPKGSYTQSIKATETVQGPTDFVFAFRLNKVHYSRRKKKITMKKHIRGAIYSDNESSDSKRVDTIGLEEEEEYYEDALDVRGVEKEDAGEEEFEVDGQAVVDEETYEPCIMIVPERSKSTDQS